MSDLEDDNEEKRLRRKLNAMGFGQPLPHGAINLVCAILDDLVTTTESFKKAKIEIEKLRELKVAWDLGVEPYKCDNSRLLAECNQLHIKLLKQKDLIEINNIEHNRQVRSLEQDKKLLEEHCAELSNRIRELEIKYNDMGKSKLNKTTLKRKPFISTVRCGEILPISSDPACSGRPQVQRPSSCICDRKDNNSYDFEKLQGSIRDQHSIIEALKRQNGAKDREIQRLNELLQGGRSPQALARDCCFKGVGALADDVEFLQKQKTAIQIELEESIKQKHEAMQRAIYLSEQNSDILSELKELQKVALKLEIDANNTVAEKEREINDITEKLTNCRDRNLELEREIRKMRQYNFEDNKENLKSEIKRLSEEKNNYLEEIKYLSQKEQELVNEVDKLSKKNSKLKSKIIVLKETAPLENIRSIQSKKNNDSLLNDDYERNSIYDLKRSSDPKVAKQNDDELNRLRSERDYYQKEYLKSIEKQQSSESLNNLKRELNEKESEINILKRDIEKMKTTRSDGVISNRSVQNAMNRLERERDVAQSTAQRLQIEKDSLREKLMAATENQMHEQRQTDEQIQHLKNKVQRMEQERREHLSSEIPTKAAINLLGEEIEELKTKLLDTRNECNQWKSQFNQVKILQEQTEKSLIDNQNKYYQVENEKGAIEFKLNKIDSSREQAQTEIGTLRGEVTLLKSTNTTLEREKDSLLIDLDNKTENIFKLENEIKRILSNKKEIEMELDRLRSKYNEKSMETLQREGTLREATSETNSLRKQMSSLKLSKDGALIENSRLANELSDVQAELTIVTRKLKESQSEVESLKLQLQQYVQEVRRAEDLLMKKDMEREEMLEHYQSLSRDAIVLEGTHHSLEIENAETKKQLIDAEAKLNDLEMHLHLRENEIKRYEKQISDLSAQVAKLETDFENKCDENRILKQDLEAIKDLCNKLDLQKDKLTEELNEHSSIRQQLQRENEKLRNDIALGSNTGRAANDGMKDLLTSSRQEIDQYAINTRSMNKEIIKLREKIQDLENKLTDEHTNAMRNEALAHEYSVQLQELKRTLVDERYEFAQAREESDRLVENEKIQEKPQKSISNEGNESSLLKIPSHSIIRQTSSPYKSQSFIPSLNFYSNEKSNNNIDKNEISEIPTVNIQSETENEFIQDSVGNNETTTIQEILEKDRLNVDFNEIIEIESNDSFKSSRSTEFMKYDTSFLPPPPPFVYPSNLKREIKKKTICIEFKGEVSQILAKCRVTKN